MAIYKDKTSTKDGRCWYFVRKKDGIQYKSKKYLTKKEAQEEEAKYILKNDNIIKKNFHIVALDYLDYIKRKKKMSTYETAFRNYYKHIYPYFKDHDINDLNTINLNKWKSEIDKQNFSFNFSNKLYSIFCTILDYAVCNYNLPNNELRKIKRFERKNDEVIKNEDKLRYITLEQFNKFIDFVENNMYKTFFIFAYYTGCRKGEITALNWHDIDFDNRVIHINKTLYSKIAGYTGENVVINSTKNNLNRDIKMSNYLYDTMLKYKKEVMQYSDFDENWYVFGNTLYLPNVSIDREKDKAFQLSGVPRITMHEFRHSHVSLLINEYVKTSREKNMKIDTAKFFLMMSDRMGHTIDVMQNTYLHLFPTIQDEIIDLLDNLC